MEPKQLLTVGCAPLRWLIAVQTTVHQGYI